MERLTFEGNFCEIARCKEVKCPYDIDCSQKQVWERLKQYEDSKLSPEDASNLHAILRLGDGMTLMRLRELAVADQEGRVIVLPCKVGDTVYFVNAKKILEFAVVGYEVDETDISWVYSEHVDKTGHTNERTFSTDRFGKNTFFTREEAEKALAEMEGKG
jgi:hypothetical protein